MRLFSDIKSRICCLAYSPDGKTLAAAAEGRMQLGFWTLPKGKFRRWHPYADTSVRSLAYSPDGTILAVGNDQGLVLPYVLAEDNYDTECHAGGPFGPQVPVYAMAFAPHLLKNPVLATASLGVSLWRLGEDGSPDDWQRPLLRRGHASLALVWAADGSALAASTKDVGEIILWWLDESLSPIRRWITTGYIPSPPSLAFSPDGHTLAAAVEEEVVLYEVTKKWTLRRKAILSGHRGKVRQVAYHPRGKILASGSDDQTIRLCDATSGKLITRFDWQLGKVRALVFAPDGMTCAAGGDNGRVVVWDVDE